MDTEQVNSSPVQDSADDSPAQTPPPAPETTPPPAETETPNQDDFQIAESTVTQEQLQEILNNRYVSMSQVSRTLGYTPNYIRKLIKRGVIKAVKPVGSQWRIPASELKRLHDDGLPAIKREEPEAFKVQRIKMSEKSKARVLGKTPEESEKKEKQKLGYPLRLFLGDDDEEEAAA